MSTSTSRFAYQDCYDVLDRALEDDRGVRVKVKTLGDGTNFRVRIHTARRIDRDENRVLYPEQDHPMHGRSVYDPLVVKLATVNGAHYVYIEKREVIIGEVEGLSEVDDAEV